MKKESFAEAVENIEDEYLLDAIGFTNKNLTNDHQRSHKKKIILTAAAVILVFITLSVGIFVALHPKDPPNDPDTPAGVKIYIEADASVVIEADKELSVISVKTLKGGILVNDDYRTASLNDTIVDIASRFVKQGQLTNENPVCLLTVENAGNAEAAEKLCADLKQAVNSVLAKELPGGAAVAYTVAQSAESTQAEELSKTHGISFARAYMIVRLTSVTKEFQTDELCKTSMQVLKTLCDIYGVEIHEDAKISLDDALEIATKSLGADAANVFVFVKRNYCETPLIKQVGFYYDNRAHLYLIDAVTGAVISSESIPALTVEEITDLAKTRYGNRTEIKTIEVDIEVFTHMLQTVPQIAFYPVLIVKMNGEKINVSYSPTGEVLF